MKTLNEKLSILDSSAGPVLVTTSDHVEFDIDDYVSMTVQGYSNTLKLMNKVSTINPEDVRNRPPVNIGNLSIGGYNG